eukprot:6197045-Pleurochrysis_carterae.AAC.4
MRNKFSRPNACSRAPEHHRSLRLKRQSRLGKLPLREMDLTPVCAEKPCDMRIIEVNELYD